MRRSSVVVVTALLMVGGTSGAVAAEPGDPIGGAVVISTTGPATDANYDAGRPSLAYNRHTNEYLAVWHADVETGPVNQNEIFGRRIDATTGMPIGGDAVRISQQGPAGDADYDAVGPVVVYNADRREYLVVWSGDGSGGSLVDDDFEIVAQRLDSSANPLGGAVTVSGMGPAGQPNFYASAPAVAYGAGEYLVVWVGGGLSAAGQLTTEWEVYGQRLDAATGAEVGADDFRISSMGPDGDLTFEPYAPAVAYNAARHEYLVVWESDDDAPPLTAPEDEVYGQRLDAATGAEVGADDFRISYMGPDGESNHSVSAPDVVYAPGIGEFLVVWAGSDLAGKFEVWGQRLDGAGGAVGTEVAISRTSPPVAQPYGDMPTVAYDRRAGTYVVAWVTAGPGDLLPLAAGENEVVVRRVDAATGIPAGTGGFRVSHAGIDGDPESDAWQPDLAGGAGEGQFLLAWEEDPQPVDNKYEIVVQRLAASSPDAVGLVDSGSGLWHLRDGAGTVTTFYYGDPGDVPFVGDWDCDGVATPGLFRQSDAYAYLRNANTQGVADIRFFFGNPSDVPLAGDFNGDGCDTLSIYRPTEQRFYIMNSLGANEGGLGAAEFSFQFGNPGDKPVVGDWDGDGIDEVGLHRESSGFFYYRDTLDTGIASGEFFFGDPGDRFVAGDWATTGYDKPAVFRSATTTFYFRHSLTQGVADAEVRWGSAGWLPVAGVFG